MEQVTSNQVKEMIDQLAAMTAAASITPEIVASIFEKMRNLNDQEREKVIKVATEYIEEIRETGVDADKCRTAGGSNVQEELDKKPDINNDESNASLNISDEIGNVLAIFSGGNFKTKKFDSSATPQSKTSASADFEIADEKGNAIVRLIGGHIYTKNFSSSNIQPTGGGGTSQANPKHLKILALGNSYTLDSFMYLPFILKEYGITCTVGIYYRSGGTLSQLHSGYASSAQPFYTIDTSSQTSWQDQGSKTPQQCVKYVDWDIVSLQQGSVDSLEYSKYQPYVRPIMRFVVDDMTKPVKFAWNININRDSSGESSVAQPKILEAIKQVIESEGIDMIFPYGTAVFNARTDATLNALGTKEMWASDLTHLNEGLPCYLAALANVQALFKYFYPYLSVMGDRMRVTSALTTAWAVKGKQGDVIGITEDNCFKAQIAAIQANKYPFEIKNI